ncbi:MAG: hypothetical protein AAGB29_11770 [Planctomycetota bacterium]
MANDLMTKERLVDLLRPAMSENVEKFSSQKSDKALQAEAEIAKIESLLSGMAEDSPARAELERATQTLAYDPSDDRKSRLRDAAIAVVTICNELGVPVEVKKPKAAPAATGGATAPADKAAGGKRRRTSPAEIERLAVTVRKALPPASTSDARCKTIEDIAGDTGLSKDAVRSALSKLKREGDAVSNGFRGPRGGWRKAPV